MSEKKLSLEEIAAIMDSEGLGYAIESSLESSRIEDKELAKLWKEAAEILEKIHEKLDEFSEYG